MSLTKGDLDLRDVAGIYFDLVKGFRTGLSVRGTSMIIPSLRGRVAYPRVGDFRSLTLEGYVLGTDPDDFYSKRSTMLERFEESLDPESLVVGAPYYGITGTASIFVRTQEGGILEGDVVGLASDEPFFQLFSIALESDDPDWQFEGS